MNQKQLPAWLTQDVNAQDGALWEWGRTSWHATMPDLIKEDPAQEIVAWEELTALEQYAFGNAVDQIVRQLLLLQTKMNAAHRERS